MTIVVRPFNKWNKKIQRRLLNATFDDGFMRRKVRINPAVRTFVAFNKHQIMGWALVFRLGHKKWFNVFVNERYKRQGVASRLICQAIKRENKLDLVIWDDITKNFYTQIKKQYPNHIVLRDWEKWREKIAKYIVGEYAKQTSYVDIMLYLLKREIFSRVF